MEASLRGFDLSKARASTRRLILIGPNAPASVTADKINFQLRTNGAIQIDAGKALVLGNSFITENGARTLTKTGPGTVSFTGSGSLVNFTGGLNMAEGTLNAGADTEDLLVSGIITFTNPSGVAATITSTNSQSIAGLAGGNTKSEFYATGATKLIYAGTLTLDGSDTTTCATAVASGTLALGRAVR